MSDNNGVMSPLNTHSLTELHGMLGDDLFDITELFGQQIQADMPRLADLAGRADWPNLARAAHALKGSCGNMGATALSQWASQLERLALAGDAAAVSAAMPALAPLADETLSALRAAGFLRP